MAPASGTVHIVGAGPGAPDLLTLKGKRCLEAADVVVYDRRVNPALLTYARPDAEIVYAGKPKTGGSVDAKEIQEIVMRRARDGKQIVCLAAGDPFVFGCGAEEAEQLSRAGIPYQIVPGVSSATAVPAYAAIPLTHRAHASSVAIVSGHSSLDGKSTADWRLLAHGVDTLVILMGIKNLREIMNALLKAGCEGARPVAIIEGGTLAAQRSVTGTVKTIAAVAAKSAIRPPAVIVVGEVARFAEPTACCDNAAGEPGSGTTGVRDGAEELSASEPKVVGCPISVRA